MTAKVRSLVLDNDRAIVFVRATHEVARVVRAGRSAEVAMKSAHRQAVDEVYWKFRTGP